MTHSLKLSVVIPTYNRQEVLSRTLPTIFSQEFPPDEYEVVIVVDGSTDGTSEMLRGLKPRCFFRVLEQPNRGLAAARNAGWKAALGNLILFLDDDMVCNRILLREHVAAHSGSGPLVVHGPVWVAPESPCSLVTDWYRAWSDAGWGRLTREMKIRWPDDVGIATNSSVPRSTLLESGGFDELFRQREEQDLGLRLWKMGVCFRYQATAVAHHFYVKSAREIVLIDARRSGLNEIRLCRKHPDYRPYSPLAKLGEFSWKRLPHQVAARLPVSLEPLLRAPFWMAEWLRWIPWFQSAAMLLLRSRASIVFWRSAMQEAGSWEALRREFGMQLPVLIYHHVGPLRPGTRSRLTVSPERFEQQVRWLAHRGYVGIRPSDWLRWCREGAGLPDKPVLLTFDDAYADVAEYALPVLRCYGFGAVAFVVTGKVGGTNAWDEIRDSGTHRLMTAEQIRYWSTQGIEFGTHSRTHADLKALAGLELEEEVAGSKAELENILGARTVSFAYPYGLYNQTVVDCVRAVFGLGFSTEEGMNDLRSDLHLLQRTMVGREDSLLEFECRLRWGWNPVQRLRSRVRLRSWVKSAARCIIGQNRV